MRVKEAEGMIWERVAVSKAVFKVSKVVKEWLGEVRKNWEETGWIKLWIFCLIQKV